MVEEGPLCVFQTQVSPEDLQEHTNPSLFVEDENDEHHCNQSQHIEKIAICNEGLNHKKEDAGSSMNVFSSLSNSEFVCQEEIISLDSVEEHNDIYFETCGKNQVLNFGIFNEVIDVPFEKCHKHYFQGSCEK